MIIQLSDCHLFADTTKTGYSDINPYASLKACLRQMKPLAADYVLFTGDLSGDYSPRSYQHLCTLIDDFIPWKKVFFLPGNHDHKDRMRQHLPSENIAIDHPLHLNYENAKVLLIDSHFKGTQAEVDLDRLQNHLSSSIKQLPFYLFMHHHPIKSDSWMDQHALLNQDKMMQLLLEYPAPIKLFHGHLHHASMKRHKNTTVYSCPSTCWQWQMEKEFALSYDRPGFRVIDVKRNQTQIIRIPPKNETDFS